MTMSIGHTLRKFIGKEVDIWLAGISIPVHGKLIEYKCRLNGPPTIVLEVEKQVEGKAARAFFYTLAYNIDAFAIYDSCEEPAELKSDGTKGETK